MHRLEEVNFSIALLMVILPFISILTSETLSLIPPPSVWSLMYCKKISQLVGSGNRFHLEILMNWGGKKEMATRYPSCKVFVLVMTAGDY